MSPNVLLEIAELQDKTVSQLVHRYEQVFEEECRILQTPVASCWRDRSGRG